MEDISQVFLIGDAPGNTDDEVKEKRQRRGEEYWNSHDFPITTQGEELKKLTENGVAIHTFFLR